MFWGAPLVARELEAGTHRLVWNQSVTRHRWLAVRLAFVALAGMAAAGLVSLLLTWAASPVDQVTGDRFSALLFGIASQPMTADVVRNLSFLGRHATIEGMRVPAAWVISTSPMLTAAGQPVDQGQYDSCVLRSPDAVAECVARLDLHVQAAYQPTTRYWPFQWFESALFLTLAGVLAAIGWWRIRQRDLGPARRR